ncbi:MAG: ATP cone domain-containing protein [Candidatus Jorgensenbacteria bacterium]
MVKWVVKRGGKKVPFSAAKFKHSIRAACKDAHIPAKRIKTVVGKVSRPILKFAAKRKTVATATLRKKALSALAKVEPKAAKAWRKHDERRRARRRK